MMAKKEKFGRSAFIGETIYGGLPCPIFWDPHYPIMQNKPPVTLITGSPGSGKTFASSVFAGHSSVMNKSTFVIDPKGDFTSLKILEQEGLINKTTIWSVFSDFGEGTVSEENRGLLDPMSLTDSMAENVSLTLDTIQKIYGTLKDDQRTGVIPIIKDVAKSRNSSFSEVIRKLRSNPNPAIRAIGTEINLACELPMAKLIVDDSSSKNPFSFNDGLMIVSLLGLSLPPLGKAESSYTHANKVSMVIMNLITLLILDSIKKMPKHIQKTIFIDEAWVVFNNEAGKDLIDQIALLGRSWNAATILATQSPLHIASAESETGGSTLDTAISTRFSFRNNNDVDNRASRIAMRLPEGESWEKTLTTLHSGQCFFQDCNGNTNIIHIMTSNEWAKCFETNPSEIEEKIKSEEI